MTEYEGPWMVGSVTPDRVVELDEDTQNAILEEIAEKEARRIPLGFRAPEDA